MVTRESTAVKPDQLDWEEETQWPKPALAGMGQEQNHQSRRQFIEPARVITPGFLRSTSLLRGIHLSAA